MRLSALVAKVVRCLLDENRKESQVGGGERYKSGLVAKAFRSTESAGEFERFTMFLHQTAFPVPVSFKHSLVSLAKT